MNEKVFWEIIEQLDWNEKGDDQGVLKPALAMLAAMSTEDIFAFDDILSEKLYQLDGIAFASNIGEDSYKEGSYFSGDYFLYVRCCVVANGEDLFKQVVNDPRLMPKDADFEPLLYLASTAFEKKTGSTNYDHTPKFNYETFSNTAGWNKPAWPR